jgi:hypothetical protein
MIKQASALGLIAVATIAAVICHETGSVASAQERDERAPWSNSTGGGRPDRWKNLYNRDDGPNSSPLQPNINNGDDSLNPDPFLSGPDPDFCIECAYPEGNPTYYGQSGGG